MRKRRKKDEKGIEDPPHTNHSLNIYSARLIFIKREGDLSVNVQIRYSKIGSARKEKLGFPENINENDLHWIRYRGERIAVYHRIEEDKGYKYKNGKPSIVHSGLAQKLERLVHEVYFKTPNIKN